MKIWYAVLLVAAMLPGAARAEDPAAAADHVAPVHGDTLSHVVRLPEVVVSTTRPGDRAPIARTTLERVAIERRNWGEDTPMALASLPGAYAYSDAGNGIGYSYLSIRGFPQRRISVLVDGVPLNDPESHEVYWIDHPDLLASTSEVEMQRGVGSALYGAASLGGSVNLEIAPMSDTPATRATVAYGSWETKRLMVEGNSGHLSGGWNLYGRYSRVETFGYRDDSWSRLWSYALSGRKIAGDQTFKVNLYGGPEETHLAYLGVPRSVLDGGLTGNPARDRRFNPITYPNERDHYFEPHYELIHSWTPRDDVSFAQTLFFYDGEGYYDEQRFDRSLADYRLTPWATADTTLLPHAYYRDTNGDGVLDRDPQGRAIVDRFDLVRRRTVKNRHFGWIPRARIAHPHGAITIGGELRGHDGRHYGEIVSGDGLPPGTPPDHTYYDYRPTTFSAGAFAREEWQVRSDVLVTTDLGWRHQAYHMRGDHFDGIRFDQSYDFALPRIGVTLTPRSAISAFASWSQARREPAFRDLYDAEGVGSVPLYRVVNVAAGIYQDPLIRPERVNDWEAGMTWRRERASLALNVFRMDFRDELVYAGQFDTDLGYPILGNAARSVHQGLELAGRIEGSLGGRLHGALDANATLSDNRFQEYREVYGTGPGDIVSYDGNAIGFFPDVLGNVSGRLMWRGATLGAAVRYVGRIFLDNSANDAASISPHTIVDLNAAWRFPAAGGHVEVGVRVNNVFDVKYEAGGYTDYDSSGALVPFYIPAATRNVLVQMRTEM